MINNSLAKKENEKRMEVKMKTLIVILLMCVGVSAQVYDQEQIDSVIIGVAKFYDIPLYADSIVYTPDTNYVSVSQLISALQMALAYTREPLETTLLYLSPAQKLRDMADKMEQKENDLAYLWGLLEKAKRYYGKNP